VSGESAVPGGATGTGDETGGSGAEAGAGGEAGLPPKAAQPKRFHGTVELDATRVGRDASRIADEGSSTAFAVFGAIRRNKPVVRRIDEFVLLTAFESRRQRPPWSRCARSRCRRRGAAFAGEENGEEREVGVVLPVECGKPGCITLAPFAFHATRTLVVAPGVKMAQQVRADGQLMAGRILYSYPVFRVIQESYVKRLKAVVLNPRTSRYVRHEDGPRDRYIGWTHEQRKRNLSLIVNNARFLILPWIQSKNLASMLKEIWSWCRGEDLNLANDAKKII